MNTQEVEVTGGEQVGLKAKWISLINTITTFLLRVKTLVDFNNLGDITIPLVSSV